MDPTSLYIPFLIPDLYPQQRQRESLFNLIKDKGTMGILPSSVSNQSP
jgi:hypothetical protein